MRRVSQLCVALLLACPVLSEAGTRVAMLPSFSDFEQRTPVRKSLASFDARLQAELLAGWDSEVLSRAGLSAVVFEQKLRAAEKADAPVLRVLPSEVLVMSVLDQQRKELRVHVTPVAEGMQIGQAKVFKVQDAKHLAEGLPKEVAQYVATVAKLGPHKAVASAAGGEKLICALLEPVSAGGVEANLVKVSPLIRAVLESAVGGGAEGVQLVDRTQTAKLLDEKTLAAINGEWNANATSGLGRMVKADLILVPLIHFQNDKQINTDLFAVDVATGQVLACRSWSGGLLDAPPADAVKQLLQEGAQAARESRAHPVADDPKLRHAEATFVTGLGEEWDGLRQLPATEAELATRMGDAALALANDSAELMNKVVLAYYGTATPNVNYPLVYEYGGDHDGIEQIAELKKSGQLALLHAQARSVFELPMNELAKGAGEYELGRLVNLYIRLGDSQKAWALLTTGGKTVQDLSGNDALYEKAVLALMNLGRYQDCVDLLETRKKWSRFCTPIITDAYRALKNPKREFELMWVNRNSVRSDTRLARLLDLGREQGKAAQVAGFAATYANPWMVNRPAPRMALIRARVAAGQKDLAIADAQCSLLAAKKENDGASQKELAEVLKGLNAQPLASLPVASGFISLPKDCHIDLIHDQTIDGKYAQEVAAHVARFWGCAVHVRAVKLDATKLSSYRKISQAVEGAQLGRTLLRVDLPAGPTLGAVLLTQTKLVSVRKNFEGDIYCAPGGAWMLFSDHYIRKFKGDDPRPMPLITAIGVSKMQGVNAKLERTAEEEAMKARDLSFSFSPMPPDLFATNGDLHLIRMDLGVSPRTGAMLQKVGAQDLLSFVAQYHQEKKEEEMAKDNPDDAVMRDLSQQISTAQPVVVQPK